MIQTLFADKQQDEIDFMDVKADAVQDYHDSKTTMLCNSKPALQPKRKNRRQKK
jgi:hypothetical protein